MGKKVTITESQYRRVFLNEDMKPIIDDGLSVYESDPIVVEQNDKSTKKIDFSKFDFKPLGRYEPGIDPNYKIIPNERLVLSNLIPNTGIDPCRPAGIFPGLDMTIYVDDTTDWCKVMSSANIDCYMGHCHVKVDGITYSWMQGHYRNDNPDNKLILNQNYRDFNKYILNFNKNISKWNNLKRLSKWGGEAILIDDEWLSKNSNNLQNWFDRNSYLGFGNVGVGTTNIFNPGWLIQKYIEFETAIEFDIQSILKQEEFKARVRESQKEYQKKLDVWEKQMEVWNQYIYKIYDQRSHMYLSQIQPDNNFIAVKQEENYPKPITPINIDLWQGDINNPFGGKSTTKKTKTEEEIFINTYDYEPKLKPEGGKEGIKKFQDWLDSKNLKWVSGANLNKGPGYGNWGPITKSLWPIYGVIYEWETKKVDRNEWKPEIPDMPKIPDTPDILDVGYVRKDLSEIELAMESFKVLLSAIDSFNSIFESQNRNDTIKFCNTKGIRSQFGPRPKSSAILVNRGTKDAEYLYWYFDICPGEGGGVWVYSQGPNSKSCGCVRTSRQDYMYADGKTYNFADTLEYSLETTDIRSTWEKMSDWASGCMDDWHCLADIASIAVLFIPVPGLNVGLSAAIDLVSAAGYALEADEGWELNAGLTLVGAFASGIDAIKYVNKGLKGGKEITKLRKALGDGLEKAEKVKLTPEWSKLDKVGQSKLYSKEFRKSLKGLSSKEIKELSNIMTSFSKSGDELVKSIKEIVGDLSNVSKQEKAGLQDILDKMSKDEGLKREIADHIIANGGKVDVKSIIKEFGKQSIVKDAIIQAGLFSLTQFYPEETANVIKKTLEFADLVLGTEMSKGFSDIVDINKQDEETKELIQKMESDLLGYQFISVDVENILDEKMPEFLAKYNVTSDDINSIDELRKLIFNGLDSIAGVQLEDTKKYLDSLYLIEEDIKEDNPNLSEEEIYNKIREEVIKKYNDTYDYILELSKNQDNNVFNTINNFQNNPENQLTDDEKNTLKDMGWRF